MDLESCQNNAIKLHSLLFWYMWPFPIRWENGNMELRFSWKSIPWSFTWLYILIYGILNCYVLLVYGNSHPNIHRVEKIFLFNTFAFSTTEGVLVHVAACSASGIITSSNELLKLSSAAYNCT